MKKLYRIALFVMSGIMLAACAGKVSAPVTGTWGLISYGPSSNPSPAASDVDTAITFGDDGKVGGSVGCNQFNGDYKIEDNQIVFGPLVSTKMACIGITGEQEAAVFDVFNNAASFVLEDDTLTITSEDGGSVVTLVRK